MEPLRKRSLAAALVPSGTTDCWPDPSIGYYRRNKHHILENCPEVDCSYKWAGGGIISNVSDLLVFANAILYSTQNEAENALISKSTILKFLKPEIEAGNRTHAGLGWFTTESENVRSIDGQKSRGGFFYHTGGAVGASSVLLIRPTDKSRDSKKPEGICVAILCNLQETSVLSLGQEIEAIFREN